MMYNAPLLATSTDLLSTFQSYNVSVLLIDDQMIIAEAVRRMLADQADIAFHYCSDPGQAIEMAGRVKPTVILQDLVMPDCDGLLLVKYFRANPSTREIPIIVLSAKEDPRVKAEAFALGANDYIVKLPDRLELIARIRYHSEGYIRLLERNEAYKRIEESQKILNAELAEAATYVRSLLPASLQGEITTDWRFIPSTQLGGDAFGYHWLDEEHFALYLLDVCGHGVGAALLSISVVNVLRSENLPKANFLSPKSVLNELNAVFPMEKHNNMFFTIWYGVYNKSTCKLTYATGGHPPAILMTGPDVSRAELFELKTPGVVIGALSDVEFQEDSCHIDPYNRLYIFSDGVYEVFKKNGSLLEFNEFVDFLKQFHTTNHARLDRIVLSIQETQGKKLFADDFSLLEVSFS
jgi:phosphoserine phosphatase RsbU/P